VLAKRGIMYMSHSKQVSAQANEHSRIPCA
jgi:hypothetical protein